MIIPVVLFVGPSRLVSMVMHDDAEDPEVLAQLYAESYLDTIYFTCDLAVTNEGFGTYETILWENWYGKVVTANTYACLPVQTEAGFIVSKLPLTDDELAKYAVIHSEIILFVHNVEKDFVS